MTEHLCSIHYVAMTCRIGNTFFCPRCIGCKERTLHRATNSRHIHRLNVIPKVTPESSEMRRVPASQQVHTRASGGQLLLIMACDVRFKCVRCHRYFNCNDGPSHSGRPHRQFDGNDHVTVRHESR